MKNDKLHARNEPANLNLTPFIVIGHFSLVICHLLNPSVRPCAEFAWLRFLCAAKFAAGKALRGGCGAPAKAIHDRKPQALFRHRHGGKAVQTATVQAAQCGKEVGGRLAQVPLGRQDFYRGVSFGMLDRSQSEKAHLFPRPEDGCVRITWQDHQRRARGVVARQLSGGPWAIRAECRTLDFSYRSLDVLYRRSPRAEQAGWGPRQSNDGG